MSLHHIKPGKMSLFMFSCFLVLQARKKTLMIQSIGSVCQIIAVVCIGNCFDFSDFFFPGSHWTRWKITVCRQNFPMLHKVFFEKLPIKILKIIFFFFLQILKIWSTFDQKIHQYSVKTITVINKLNWIPINQSITNSPISWHSFIKSIVSNHKLLSLFTHFRFLNVKIVELFQLKKENL